MLPVLRLGRRFAAHGVETGRFTPPLSRIRDKRPPLRDPLRFALLPRLLRESLSTQLENRSSRDSPTERLFQKHALAHQI